MSGRLLPALAWLASLAPFLLAAPFGPGLELAGASQLGLALLPWLALAGLPAGGAAPIRLWLALALPTLALGAALDAGRGLAVRPLLLAAGLGLAEVLLLALARRAALRASARAAAAYALAWLALVPGLAALGTALAFTAGASQPVDAGGVGDGLGARIAGLSPLVSTHRWSGAGRLAEVERAESWLALAACLGLLVAARGARVWPAPGPAVS